MHARAQLFKAMAEVQALNEFREYLESGGYTNVIVLPTNPLYPDGPNKPERWAGICKFVYTTAIVTGDVFDRQSITDRWCYHSAGEALIALLTWDSLKDREPQGWHRHPASGRRRPDGDATQEYVHY